MKAGAVTEKAFMRQVLELARLTGWLVYHTHDSRRSAFGFPDLCLCRPPRLIFAELKSIRGRLRPEQKLWLAALSACPGVEVAVWRPANFEEIAEVLRR